MELRSGKEIGGGFRQEKKQDEASPTIPIDVAAAGIHSSHEDVFVHRMEMIEDRLKVLDNLDDRLKKTDQLEAQLQSLATTVAQLTTLFVDKAKMPAGLGVLALSDRAGNIPIQQARVKDTIAQFEEQMWSGASPPKAVTSPKKNQVPAQLEVSIPTRVDNLQPQIQGETSYNRREGKQPIGDDEEVTLPASMTTQRNARQPFAIEAKLDLPSYGGEIDGEKLDHWLAQLETYFRLYTYSDVERVLYASLKLTSHALVWWNAYMRSHDVEVLSWPSFKTLLKRQFYPIGYEEARWVKWKHMKQWYNQSVQDYTTEFFRQALGLGISLDNEDTFMKYKGGLHEDIRNELTLFHVEDITDASTKAIAIEVRNKARGGRKSSQPNISMKGDLPKTAVKKQEQLHCTHCKKDGHTSDKCWFLHSELKPKWWDDRGEGNQKSKKKVALNVNENEAITLDEVKEVDPTLALMARGKEVVQDTSYDEREELFVVKVQVKNKLVDAIIDPGSQRNLISERLVEELGLTTSQHPNPHTLGWFNKNAECDVTKQCVLKFAITSRYIDEVKCEVVPVDVCHIVLGNQYLWDRDAVYYRRSQMYHFMKGGQSFMIKRATSTTKEVITAALQVKLVNKFSGLIMFQEHPIEASKSAWNMAEITAVKTVKPNHGVRRNDPCYIQQHVGKQVEDKFLQAIQNSTPIKYAAQMAYTMLEQQKKRHTPNARRNAYRIAHSCLCNFAGIQYCTFPGSISEYSTLFMRNYDIAYDTQMSKKPKYKLVWRPRSYTVGVSPPLA